MHKKQILIEFGSNTAKVFSLSKIKPLGKTEIHPLRLADGLDSQDRLASPVMDEMIRLIDNTKTEHPHAKIHLIATQALRSARNQAEIISKLYNTTGLSLQILSPQDEARAAFMGIMAVSRIQGDMLSFDIGGASTEIIFGKNGKLKQWKSFPIGAVNLTMDSPADPSFESQINRLITKDAIAEIMLSNIGSFRLVGCGGSVNTALSIALAHHSQSYSEDSGHELYLAEITRQIELMRPLSAGEIAAIAGMDPTRADIMLAALCIIRHIMDISHKESFTISGGGVRQGYFLL